MSIKKIKPEELVKYTKYPYLAMDANGSWYTYTTEPYIDTKDDVWGCKNGICDESFINIGYDGDWKDSLFIDENRVLLEPNILSKMKAYCDNIGNDCKYCELELNNNCLITAAPSGWTDELIKHTIKVLEKGDQ